MVTGVGGRPAGGRTRGMGRPEPQSSCWGVAEEGRCLLASPSPGYSPDNTVYFRASCATMLTRPFSRESRALPSSIRYLDSQARQYCSRDCSRLLQGALKLPGGGQGP